jgi:outer membrane receptor protein involved in Fe transport
MRSSWIKGLALLAAFALLAPVALAQTTGRIEGRVSGENGDPLPGVTVQVSSPALQGDRIAVTDAGGNFRFVGLPVGTYNLRASLEGFGIVEQPSINVQLDRTVTLALTLTGAFGEEVTISGTAPIIDTTSTTSGANFGEELIEDLPTTRTFTGLAFQAPGVVSGGLGRNPSIGGASAAENRYVIDGLDTTNAAFGTVGTAVPQEFVREVEVKTGGYEAEYGGALGGVINVITKSGGNELEGDIFAYYNDDSLQSDTPPVPTVGRNLGFEEYDFGAALGGKIIQDKLWYFVAANPSYQDSFVETLGGLEDTEELDRVYYSGKLTWQLNPNHQLVASGYGDPGEGNDTILGSYGRIGTNDEFGATNYGLTYNGTFSSSVFAEASVGRYEEEEVSEPYDGFGGGPRISVHTTAGFVRNLVQQNFNCGGNLDPFYSPFAVYFTAFGCEGATFRVDDNVNARDEIRGALTWFGNTGPIDHEVKVGGSVRDVEYKDSASYPGRNLDPFFDSDGTLVDAGGMRGQRIELRGDHVRFIDYDQNSEGSTDEQAVYLQDSVRFNDYFSLNLGVRADSFESRGVGSDNLEASGGLPRHLDFGFSDMVAPRIGFTWDAFQNGRSKIYGHYGRFYESVPLDINVRAFGNELFQFYLFDYPTDAAGNVVMPTLDNPGDFFAQSIFGTGTGVDPDLEPMYTEEILGGFEYEVVSNVAIGLKYVTRDINNVIEDISVTAGHTYFITNPGQQFCGDPVLGGPIFDENLDIPLPGECVNFPAAVREYEAVELTLNKRFSNNWQLFGSAVWSENFGNYGGLFRQDNGQLDPNITSLFDLPSLLEGATGLLPNDREYQFKLYGSYLWPFRLTTGFNFQYLDGTPISQLGAHSLYGLDERFVTPRGSFGRTPDVWNLDLSLQYPIALGGSDLKLIVDVFNITDEQEATVVDQTWNFAFPTDPDPSCGGDDAGCEFGNPNFGEALAYQTPRTIRLGAKYSF